jgi:hypothetical protein
LTETFQDVLGNNGIKETCVYGIQLASVARVQSWHVFFSNTVADLGDLKTLADQVSAMRDLSFNLLVFIGDALLCD